MRAADQDPGPPAAGRQLGRTAGRLRRPQRQRRCISRPGSETFRGPGTSFRPRNGRKGADGEQSAAGGRGSACLAIVGRFPLSAVSRRNLKRRRCSDATGFKSELETAAGRRPVTGDSVETRRLLADRDGICFCISTLSQKSSHTVTHPAYTLSHPPITPLPLSVHHPYTASLHLSTPPVSLPPQDLCTAAASALQHSIRI